MLYKQGLSTYEIAEKLGVGGSTVWKALKRAGVRMRDSRGGRGELESHFYLGPAVLTDRVAPDLPRVVGRYYGCGV
ncbi:helix-turn-helix domain-containing protein [Streptomyces parvulus]|uniref:helix-turn-helix domain-containing protein n=1 Tax=Streptomyces parvulus TaxID=146923 RepID=UPI0033C3BEAF